MSAGAFSQLLDYEARAKEAVLRVSSKDLNSNTLSYIVFTVSDVKLAVDIAAVSDVVRLPKYTQFSSTKEWVLGFSNIKGVPITLIDFGLLLERKSSAGGKSQALVLENEYWLSALVVNHVIGIRHIDKKERVALTGDEGGVLNCTHKLQVAGFESETVYELNLDSVLQARLNDI